MVVINCEIYYFDIIFNYSKKWKSISFKGLPITPGIIEFLIIMLLSGRTLKRNKIANSILKYHLENGGKKI